MTRLFSFALRAVRLACFALTLASFTTEPARADCYELIGCSDRDYMHIENLVQLSCENLWHVRNRIYDEHGYCFQTWRAQQAFDNSDCWVEEQADVELSEIEQYNITRIVGAESQNGCW
ncbi:MAG: YARHG domain-containing protein [Propylenella sp.]